MYKPIKCAYCETEYPRTRKPKRPDFTEFAITPDDYIECCGCHLWRWAVNGKGYALAHINGKSNQYVNRWQLGLEVGNPLEACHSCRNTRCVKRAHIRADTSQANHDDMIVDGTVLKCERHGRAKLTREQAYQIKYCETGTNAEISRRYGLYHSTIWNIQNGLTWKDV